MSSAELFTNRRIAAVVSVTALVAVLAFTEGGQRLLGWLHEIGVILITN
jgi:hypothetical protein